MIHFPAMNKLNVAKRHSPVDNCLSFITENVIGLCFAFPSDNMMTTVSNKVHHATHTYMIAFASNGLCLMVIMNQLYIIHT